MLVLSDVSLWGTGNTVTLAAPVVGIDVQAGAGRVTLTNCVGGGSFQEAAAKYAGLGSVLEKNCDWSIKNAPGVPRLVTMDPAKLTIIQSTPP